MKGIVSRADLGNVISRNNIMILKKPNLRVNLSDFYSETAVHRNVCGIGVWKNFAKFTENTYDGVIFCKKRLWRTLPSLQLISEVCGTGLHHFVEAIKS